jgi:hypothetical protein
MLMEHSFNNNSVYILYLCKYLQLYIIAVQSGRSKEINMVESHSASVGFESKIETGLATQPITILGLRFNVQSPYSAGHVCTKGEPRR